MSMNAVKKVALVLPSLKFGGAERVALNLAKAFKAKGIEVDFLLMSFEGEFLAEAMQHHKVVDLRCRRTWMLPGKLVAYLWQHKPDALISSFWKLNLCACLAGLLNPRIKLALWEHSPPSHSNPAWLYAISASLFYQLATSIIAVSSGVESDVLRHTRGLRRKTLVIFNPIQPPQDPVSLDKTTAGRRIIWVGRLDTPKNPGLALEAFALLPKKSGYTLQFIGDGRMGPALQQRAVALGLEQSVEFLGFQENPYSFMKEADLLVLSSDSEGLPTVLIEAMYVGLRVVGTDCGAGIHDILEDQRYGSIVPLGNPHALANAIEGELNISCDRQAQIDGAKRFNPDLISELFLRVLRLPIS